MNNLNIYDKDRQARTLRTTESNGVHAPHHIIEPGGTAFDMFNRLRVSTRGYRFDSQLTYRIDADLWNTATVGGSSAVAHDATNRCATLTAASGGAGNSAILQAAYHAPYTPGASQLVFITGILGDEPVTGGEVGMGYFDGLDGVWLKRTPTGVYVGITTSTDAADESVEQADWNIDPMDGTGPSGLVLDLTKSQIFAAGLQALYVGSVVVGFDIGSKLVPVHEFHHANIIVDPYMAQASLPVRYWATANSTASNVIMRAVCSTVISESGEDLNDMAGREFSASNGITAITGIAARRPVLSIRNAATFNSLHNDAISIPQAAEVLVENQNAYVEIVKGGTLTGASFAAVNATYSTMEADVAASAISGGVVIDSFFATQSATVRQAAERSLSGKALLAYSQLLSTPDVLSVVVTPFTGSNLTARAALKWKEIR